MADFIGDDLDLFELEKFNEKKNSNALVIYANADGSTFTNGSTGNVLPQSNYIFAKFPVQNTKIEIGDPKTNQQGFQKGFKSYTLNQWHSRIPVQKERWSVANLTLFEPSGKATGVFVQDGRVSQPGSNFPYYTMKTELAGKNTTFNDYSVVAIMKDNTVELFESDGTSTAEQKVLRRLSNIKYAFSGVRWLIKNGGPLNSNIGILLKDEARAKTSVGFSGKNMMVAVTRANDSDQNNVPQDWDKWANTLRKLDSTATWVSMDGGGSPAININGTLKLRSYKEKPEGRPVSTVILWYK